MFFVLFLLLIKDKKAAGNFDVNNTAGQPASAERFVVRAADRLSLYEVCLSLYIN